MNVLEKNIQDSVKLSTLMHHVSLSGLYYFTEFTYISLQPLFYCLTDCFGECVG